MKKEETILSIKKEIKILTELTEGYSIKSLFYIDTMGQIEGLKSSIEIIRKINK